MDVSCDKLNNFEPFNIGPMNIVCNKCDAVHFEAETTSNDNDLFSLCCHKGKIRLNNLQSNDFFRNLYDGISSQDPDIQKRSKNYFENIRSFNASFAMISTEAQIVDRVVNGEYMFGVYNIFYHRTQNAQLYFYHPETCHMRPKFAPNCIKLIHM